MEGGFDITNLGAILFANDISNFPSIHSKTVRVIKYKGQGKRESAGEEQEGVRGYAVGFSGLIRYIMKELPKDERYIKGVRHVVPRYSKTAIREIVANALIHQDFTLSGGGEYQAISAVIADTRKAKKIVPADKDQGKRNARYVPYWAR
jgi:predicted HTH transcriptional regulator